MRRLAMDAAARAKNDLPPRRGLEGLPDYLAVAGLDSDAKSPPTSSPHGFKGLTVAGRRAIRDATAVLAEQRDTLAFWTVTLPPAAAEACNREKLATFQRRLIEFARRALRKRGVDPLVVLVAEFHPHRKALDGGPIVHWHACVKARQSPTDPWALSVADWHRVVRWAHSAAFGEARGHTKGCRIEPARKDPGRYLSKYLTKARSDCERFRGTRWEGCVPKQWWLWTGELRALVQQCRIKPPASFLRWCCRWADALQDLGEAHSELIQIGEDGPVVGRWFAFTSEEALDRAIAAWLEDVLGLVDAVSGAVDPTEWGPGGPEEIGVAEPVSRCDD